MLPEKDGPIERLLSRASLVLGPRVLSISRPDEIMSTHQSWYTPHAHLKSVRVLASKCRYRAARPTPSVRYFLFAQRLSPVMGNGSGDT
ncbi:hypothetical protein EVAR_28507_1 [Eumeta japonica]|uniref:Uncharacterized protein n=1 Tax=Eumeta variegata TaxID=151549 RepID=A0A4C1WSQ5_EUMVA|nr:hypothetical protein EVAR_28507_1 [Eumeta japonica]